MDNHQTYSEALAALEKIVSQIDDESIGLDELAGKVDEANSLLAYCESKLRVIEDDVNKVMRS